MAADSLTATLRGARRRRIRRRTGQSVAVLTAVCAVTLGLQTIGGTPIGGRNPVSLNHPGKKPAFSGQSGRSNSTADIPLSIPAGSWQVEKSAPPALISGTGHSPVQPNPGPVPQSAAPAAVKEKSSFVLVRSQPVETIRTPSPATEAEPENSPPSSVPSSYIAVSTASMPSPLVITTAQTVSPQAIATTDGPEAPDSVSDADLFTLADGRPAALCRLASGGAHWFWLDRLTMR
ncbi:MAG: hypothetical protein EOP86_20660 [Verrucomicrobiaceae bacterium]|nr:MAG: hypothetical protein EOP86_20660 [Verrucomicrobiaceae bacterium]